MLLARWGVSRDAKRQGFLPVSVPEHSLLPVFYGLFVMCPKRLHALCL